LVWKRFVLSVVAILVSLSLYGCGGSSAPISVAVTAASSNVDATDSVTLSAVVTHDKNAAGVSWTVGGGGALSGTSTTAATYTAPASSTTALTVTVTATSIADPKQSGTATIAVPAAPTITTASLTAGTVGTAYSLTLSGSGGISPYSFSIATGTLPSGLTMTSAGAITGTPMAAGAGTTNLTFQMTDSGKAPPLTATATLGLTIKAAPAIVFPTTLAAATYKAAYTASVAATGGAGTLTYSLASGALPAGLTLSAAGAISGTPTVVGTFPITVKAADAFGDSATQAFSLTVSYPALTITPPTLPTGYVGSTYPSITLAATGGSGTGFTFAVTSGSSLPAGLSVSAAGVISGKPTAVGTVSTSVTVTDSASNTGSATLSFTIKAAVSITTPTTLPLGYVGGAYSQTLAATGGSGAGYTWAVSSGSTLPGGLTLSAAGLLSGTPTATGTPTFGVTVTDSASNTATATFSMTISPGVSITTSTTLPGGYQGTVYPGATLAATSGAGAPYTWTWAAASGSSLPAGLSLSTGGAITGTPTGSGTFRIVVTAKDSVSNTATATFSLTVEATLAVTTASPLKSGTINVPYSTTIAATGGSGTGYTWTTTASTLGTLNLSLSSAGVLSGTPASTGTATFTAQVTDSQNHTATASFSVSIYSVLTITTASLPAGIVGTSYSQTLSAGGGSGSGYTWTASASNLATYGLALSSAGVVSGSPTAAGTANFTANATDSSSNTASAPLSITIYSALTLPAPSASIPGPATVGSTYDGTISLSGGSGSYNWTITGLPADGLSAVLSGPTQHITGTPTSATTVTFNVTVKDTVTNQTVGPYLYSIVVSNPAPLTLPAPNPTSLPSATVNQSYSGAINATGGAAPYTWTVNTVAVPTNGTAISLTNGLTATNTGGNTLSIAGTPTSTGTVTIAASVKDNLGTTVGPNTYTVAVNAAGSQVSGHIDLTNNCGGITLPQITLSINTSPVQTTNTDSSGNYSFASIPNGTYTITPSITGPSSVFYPATLTNVVVNNTALNQENILASLGYTVSGTVSYGGAQTGQVYVSLNSNNCGGNPLGTSISAAGAFTIRGVPPGAYTLTSWMDTLGFGYANASAPSGSTSPIDVSNANNSGASATMTDPAAYTLTSGPTLDSISPIDQGVVVNFGAITTHPSSGNKVELPTSYTIQWSTSSTFTSPTSYNIKAGGANGTGVWFLSNSIPSLAGKFSNSTPYYFRASGNVGGVAGPWTVYGGGTPLSVTIGAPTGGSTVSGAITFSATPTGPLYVGFFDQNTGNAYGTRVASPVSPQNYTVQVPNGTNYFFFVILDQNNDGVVDSGDITNTGGNNDKVPYVVSGNQTANFTLAPAGSTASVTTQHWTQTFSGITGSGFNLNFNVRAGTKLPVSVTLMSGPHVINPIDMGKCTDCGSNQFQYYVGIGGTTPAVNDAYGFKVTYNNGTSETVTASVTAVLNAFATNLAPTTGSSTSTQPTFTWTDPASASSYTYQFYISDNNGNQIWQIPSNNSKSNGFSSSITSITWGTDPTGDSSNTPSPSILTTGVQYNWQIQLQDTNGNSTQTQVDYIP